MTPRPQRKLLRGGIALIHDEDSHVVPTVTDILIEGSIITKVAPKITIEHKSKDLQVVDCTGKIISPGFVSTHSHLWQTQLKGRNFDHTLYEYFPRGHFSGVFYDEDDMFWGQLGGAMEAIDAGTTTVVDHSHLNLTQDFSKRAVAALEISGLRAIYCYQHPRYVRSWNPFRVEEDSTSPWIRQTFTSLASQTKSASGRVHMGFAADSLYLPRDVLRETVGFYRQAGAKIITSHGVHGPGFPPGPTAVRTLNDAGLLAKDVIVSHSNSLNPGDADLYAATGANCATTPNTELQMGFPPVALDAAFGGHTSLGVDCHTWSTGFMPGEMRQLLQWARCQRAIQLGMDGGKWSRHVGYSIESVFNLATIKGAKAAGLECEIGRISEGKRADLVIFSTDSPPMLGAARQNPLAAVVLHSSERDVEGVIVDGIWRKQSGKLADIHVGEVDVGLSEKLGLGKRGVIGWREVAREILKSQEKLAVKVDAVEEEPVVQAMINSLKMDRSKMVD